MKWGLFFPEPLMAQKIGGFGDSQAQACIPVLLLPYLLATLDKGIHFSDLSLFRKS